jgi:hypothetical protein
VAIKYLSYNNDSVDGDNLKEELETAEPNVWLQLMYC